MSNREEGGVMHRETPSTRQTGPRVLIIIQNLHVPFDRRVWLESCALTAAGYDVTVVCPKGKGDPARARLDGVTMLKYRPYSPGGRAIDFVLEYLYSFAATAWLNGVNLAVRPAMILGWRVSGSRSRG
jgi:hypothetical protein